MKIVVSSITTVLIVCWCQECLAQTGWSWKRLGWFAKDSKEVEPIELTDEPAKSIWQSPFGDTTSWSRPREWRTPAFMRRMNENNARLWRNTKRGVGHWASSTGAAIRNSTYDTWDAITRAATPKFKTEDDPPDRPAPDFGGVQEFLAKPKLKF